MARQFADMNEPADPQALAALDIAEVIQTVRRFNAAAKAYITVSAMGIVGPQNPAFEDVFEWGQKVDDVLHVLFPMDYGPKDASREEQDDEATAFMLDNLLRALGEAPRR